MRFCLVIAAVLLPVLLAAGPMQAADAASSLVVTPGRAPYTSETEYQLLVTPSGAFKGKTLSVDVFVRDKRIATGPKLDAGLRTAVPLPVEAFSDGENVLTCKLMESGQELATATTTLVKLPPKPNEVKIDHLTNSLIVDGRPYLPVGFYCDADFGTLAEEESIHGFNMISPYWSRTSARSADELAQVKKALDRCASVGVRMNYHIKAACMGLEGKALDDAIRPEIEAFRDHPALLSWYIADEPEYHSVTPAHLEAAYKLVKKLDPYHPITVCIARLSEMPKFLSAMDIIMSDSYPIPHMPVTHVGDSMDRAHQGTSNAMPVWVIPQVFGGGEFWYREPTAREVRVMTYLALIHGATGIQSFVRRPPIGNPGSPVVWSECRTLAMETSQIAPAIVSQEKAPAVSSSVPDVQARAFLDRGMLFVLAANTSVKPAAMQLKIGAGGAAALASGNGPVGPRNGFSGKADALFERRELDVKDGVLDDMIDGMSTRIYRIPVGPMSRNEVEVSADNLVPNCSFEEIVSAGSPANCYTTRSKHPYANAILDPFVYKHGRQSVRLTVPEDGNAIGLSPVFVRDPAFRPVDRSNKPWPYWYTYKPGDQLTVSIWARGKEPGLTMRLSDGSIEGFPKQFTLTTDWQRYEATGTVNKARRYPGLSFSLVGKGTAWFDLIEVKVKTPLPL